MMKKILISLGSVIMVSVIIFFFPKEYNVPDKRCIGFVSADSAIGVDAVGISTRQYRCFGWVRNNKPQGQVNNIPENTVIDTSTDYNSSLFEDCNIDGCAKMEDFLKENGLLKENWHTFFSYTLRGGSDHPVHMLVITRLITPFNEESLQQEFPHEALIIDTTDETNPRLFQRFELKDVFHPVPHHWDHSISQDLDGSVRFGLPQWVCGEEGKVCENGEMESEVRLYFDEILGKYVLERIL